MECSVQRFHHVAVLLRAALSPSSFQILQKKESYSVPTPGLQNEEVWSYHWKGRC